MIWFFIAGWIAGVIGTLLFGYAMSRKWEDNGKNKRS